MAKVKRVLTLNPHVLMIETKFNKVALKIKINVRAYFN
jgi:hypothetical protein